MSDLYNNVVYNVVHITVCMKILVQMPSCFVLRYENGYEKDSYQGNHIFRPPRDED